MVRSSRSLLVSKEKKKRKREREEDLLKQRSCDRINFSPTDDDFARMALVLLKGIQNDK